jgi:hypothetical protein
MTKKCVAASLLHHWFCGVGTLARKLDDHANFKAAADHSLPCCREQR